MTYEELVDDFRLWACNLHEQALATVIAIHSPEEITLPDGSFGKNCYECEGLEYPCLTMKMIHLDLTA